MFISVLDLFKVGIGPSSSHTMGPMVAANAFLNDVANYVDSNPDTAVYHIRCTLKDSLAYTGVGHATDKAVVLGLHGYLPDTIIDENMDEVIDRTWNSKTVTIGEDKVASFFSEDDIIFDTKNWGRKLKSLFESDNYDFLKNINSEKDKLKDLHYTSVRNMYNAIIILLMALNDNNKYDKLIKEYGDLRDELNTKYEEQVKSKKLTEKEEKIIG